MIAASTFQDDLKTHRDALIATIARLFGTPVAEKTLDQYAKSLKVDQRKAEDDVLSLAARLKLGAVNAYLGVIPAFRNIQLSKIADRLAAQESTHFALLNFDLRRPFAPTMSFGA